MMPVPPETPPTKLESMPPQSSDCSQAAERLARYFQSLSAASVAELGHYYAPDARFKDPFNAVQGVPAIAAIFRHMFATLEQPHFVITGQVLQGQQCFMTWEFRFRFRRFSVEQPQVILGASQLVFSPQGLVTMHRDYWDAAEELYEKLPLVGGLMRWLKRRASH